MYLFWLKKPQDNHETTVVPLDDIRELVNYMFMCSALSKSHDGQIGEINGLKYYSPSATRVGTGHSPPQSRHSSFDLHEGEVLSGTNIGPRFDSIEAADTLRRKGRPPASGQLVQSAFINTYSAERCRLLSNFWSIKANRHLDRPNDFVVYEPPIGLTPPACF